MIGDNVTKKKEEKREYHPDPKKLWEEYHRVIAPVIVMKKYDNE